MFPEQNMMLKVNGELIAKHHIDDRHQFAVNRNDHIGYLQWAFGIVQFCFGDLSAKEAVVRILFILIGWNVAAIGHWRTVLARSAVLAGLRRGRRGCWLRTY